MKTSTKLKKENTIINAAEAVFAKVGFKNARMEDIAAEANITKVTLYSYYVSKDNLIMAVTYRVLKRLEEAYRNTLNEHSEANGLELTIQIMETFIGFCEKNYFYSEVLLEYFAMIRSTSNLKDYEKLSEATKESDYLDKLEKLHYYPFKVTAQAIEKGIKDGSIDSKIDPNFATVNVWVVIVGFVKVIAASGDYATPVFQVKLEDIRKFNLKLLKSLLQGKITYG